jgi:hypothetical protein
LRPLPTAAREQGARVAAPCSALRPEGQEPANYPAREVFPVRGEKKVKGNAEPIVTTRGRLPPEKVKGNLKNDSNSVVRNACAERLFGTPAPNVCSEQTFGWPGAVRPGRRCGLAYVIRSAWPSPLLSIGPARRI